MEKLVGKLRHAAIGIPAGKSLFGPINQLMAMKPRTIIWQRCPDVRHAFQDWQQLIMEASREPTHVNELVPGPADYKGTLDASGEAAGGVWLPGRRELAPIVWRVKWPTEVTKRLVTEANPKGDITNSDLELAGGLLHLAALAQHFDIRERTVLSKTDNLATLYWQRKGTQSGDRCSTGCFQSQHRNGTTTLSSCPWTQVGLQMDAGNASAN